MQTQLRPIPEYISVPHYEGFFMPTFFSVGNLATKRNKLLQPAVYHYLTSLPGCQFWNKMALNGNKTTVLGTNSALYANLSPVLVLLSKMLHSLCEETKHIHFLNVPPQQTISTERRELDETSKRHYFIHNRTAKKAAS